MTIPMNDLECGQEGCVLSIKTVGDMRRRLLDLGLVPGTFIQRVMNSPAGDPACYRVRGAMIALRHLDAKDILVSI